MHFEYGTLKFGWGEPSFEYYYFLLTAELWLLFFFFFDFELEGMTLVCEGLRPGIVTYLAKHK